jgi:3-isopropylmalate dehydrogenase
VLKAGFRTIDIADATTAQDKILNTQKMGDVIIQELSTITVPVA